MSKFTLKTASLFLLSMVSLAVWAQTPWSDEAEKSEPTAEPVESQSAPAMEAGSPAEMMEESPVPAPQPEPEPQPVPQPEPAAAPAPAAPPAKVVQQQKGDVLVTPAGVRLLDTPRRGVEMEKVRNELGNPLEELPAVGDPPITRWVYSDRTVYFEYSRVIHVVAR